MLLLLIAIAALIATVPGSCGLSERSSSLGGLSIPPEKAPLLLGGFNDILGSLITNLSFTDEGAVELVKKMRVGALRHPGGTVANYWSLVNGTYTEPCNSGGLFGNHCSDAESIRDNGLNESFTPQNFVAPSAVGGLALQDSLYNNDSSGVILPVVFVLNLFTLSGEEMLAQVDALKTIPGNRTLLLEMGNEYFYSLAYGTVFPNASAYINKLRPLSMKIRAELPNAKISVVSDPKDPLNRDWDLTLSKAIRDNPSLFDAITIHDYNCCDNFLEPDDPGFNQTLALYGPRFLPGVAEYVKTLFSQQNKTLPVWMSEFNVGPLTFDNLQQKGLAYSVQHALFAINFNFAAACETSGIWDIAMLHMLWQQRGLKSSVFTWLYGWGASQLRKNRDEPWEEHTRWTALGQIYAELGVFSKGGFDAIECIPQAALNVSKQANISGELVDCVRGLRFRSTSGGDVGFVLTNGCDAGIPIHIQIPSTNMPVARVYTHNLGAGAIHGNRSMQSFTQCSGGEIFECGPVDPVKPNLRRGDEGWRFELPMLSITFIRHKTTN